MIQRKIERITASPLQPGFLGEGHFASAVVDGTDFRKTDPFMLLMDDQLNLPGGPPVGGPHPHAGFETVTLVLKGNEKEWKTGSLELMTAGKGIIHTEEITTRTEVRILQLWLVLPPEKRWTEPMLQKLLPESVPVVKTSQSKIKVYSGSSNGATSPLKSDTHFTLAEFTLESKAEVVQQIPASYNGFIYVVSGNVQVGATVVKEGEAGWFDLHETDAGSEILFKAGEQGARFVLYAGAPHHVPVVHYGPFIGDNENDIRRLYQEYRAGKMPHLNDLPESRKIIL